jgi:hypothetical protein
MALARESKGDRTRPSRMMRRRPTLSAHRASASEPNADSDIHANSFARSAWLSSKVLEIHGDAIPGIDSVYPW